MLRWLITLLLLLPTVLAAATTTTPVEREAELRALLAALDPADTSPAAEGIRLAYAEVLTFDLERDFATALTLLEGLLERAHTAEPPDEARLAVLEHALAHARFYLGQPVERVEPLLLSALARRQALYGPDSPEVLAYRGDMGIFYGRTGRPDLSETEHRTVAEAYSALDPNSSSALHARTQWAIVLGRLARWNTAEAVFRDVIARRMQQNGPDAPAPEYELHLLAWVLFSTNRVGEAVPLLEQIVATRTRERGPDATGTLTSRYNLASLYERTGRFDEAEEILRADLDRALARPDPGWHEPAGYHERLGDLALRRGHATDAVGHYETALAAYRQPPAGGWRDEDSRTLEKTLGAYANALDAAGDRPAARRAAVEALDHREQEFQRRLGYTSESDRLDFAANERPFDQPASLDDPDLLARAVVRLQGLILDSLIEDAALVQATRDPAAADLLRRYRTALAAPVVPDAPANPDPLELPELDQLEKQLIQLLGGSQLTRRALHIDPADVLRALPADAALVNFVRYAPVDSGDPHAHVEHYLALLGTAAAGWSIVPLGLAADLDDAVDRYRILTTSSGPLAWATALRARVLDPVREALPAGVTTLCLVPDGSLHRINFATLPEADGRSFAIQRHRYLWLDSARDLLRPRLATPTPTADTFRVLADPALHGELAPLPALPGTKQEVAAILTSWPDAHVLTGDEATPAAALALPAPGVLHFAAHGYWASDDADHRSALQQAGIALAGPDGFLTAAQLAAADLSTTQLVVVSACGSAQGAVQDGEGVLGLRRALARAGVRHSLLSLWPLDDDTSPALMAVFYQALKAGASPAAAYQHALAETLPPLAQRLGPATALRQAGALIMVGAP